MTFSLSLPSLLLKLPFARGHQNSNNRIFLKGVFVMLRTLPRFSSESVIFSDASSQRMGRDKPTMIASKDHYYITSAKSVLGIGSWEIYTYIIYVFLASRKRFRHLKCWVFQGLSVVQVMKEETPALNRSACYFAFIGKGKKGNDVVYTCVDKMSLPKVHLFLVLVHRYR